MPTSNREEQLQTLLALYKEKKTAIQKRLSEFAAILPEEYFYELLYCLMTPQTSAESADTVVEDLKRVSFHNQPVDPEPFLRNKNNYIRFHKTKSKHLLKVKEEFPVILNALLNGSSPTELREWLIKHVKGLGYKEATHFLRNIGKNGELTILDRHILRNLKRYGAIRSLPQSLSRKQYLSIEKRFVKFSQNIGIPVDELDLLFWSMETGAIRK